MKTGLVIGIVLMLLSAIGVFVCIGLVASTNGRVSSDEALLIAVPLGILFIVSLALTGFSALGLSKRKQKSI